MFENPIFLLGISTLFASIPVAIWLYLLFRKGERSKKTVALVFLLGCLTAPALLGLQYLWDIFPNFNLASFIESNIQSQSRVFIAMFLLFAALEEIFKMYVIIAIDKRTILIKTIGDSIRYSIASALAFSFIENIYYLYQFWPSISLGELVGMYIFRSIFTACAHMIFSGIFGYYYGMGKYSVYLTQQAKIIGQKQRIGRFISKIFNLPLSHANQQQMIIKGLFIAISIHAIFNYLLQFNMVLPVMLFVIMGYGYLRYLLNRKSGRLILETDITEITKSTMSKRDEDAIIELLGIWFKKERYVDVIQTANRLLEKDQDNPVIKLLKAKSLEKINSKNIYKKILGTEEENQEISDKKSIISKYAKDKTRRIKKSKVKKQPKQAQKKVKKGHLLDKYTGEGEFKL